MRRSLMLTTGLLGQATAVGALSLISGIASGAWTGYPAACVVGNSSFIPYTNNGGDQFLSEVSNDTGAVIDTLTLSTAYTAIQDDHINPQVIETPGGALLCAYAGHANDSVIRFRRSSNKTLAGFGSEYTKSTSGTTTYPQMFVHASTGHIYLIWRNTALKWAIMVSTDDGLNWTILGDFLSDTDQLYCTGDWVSADKIRFFSMYVPTSADAHIVVFELDVVTGALTSAAGTISNVRTSSPKQTAARTDLAELIAPASGNSGVIYSAKAGALLYGVVTGDQQFCDYYSAFYNGSGGQFDPGNWTLTLIVAGGLGIGDTEVPPYQRAGRHAWSYESGLTYPRIFLSRMVRGVSYIEQWDAQDALGASWLCTMYFDSQAIGLTSMVQRPQSIIGASSKLPFFYMHGAYSKYDNFSTDIKWPVISKRGTKAPVITSAASFSTPEFKALEITLTADQPVGWRISGGADAALFYCAGDKLYLQSKQYLSPADANTDNVYEVQVTATALNGKTATQNITVPITQAAYAPSNLLLQSQTFDNASWTKNFSTISANTAEVLDPLGTNLAEKLIQDTSTNNHRIQQSVSASASSQYTLSCYLHEGGADFASLNGFDGTTSFGAIFDLVRGLMVCQPSPGGSITAHGMQAVANGWYRCWVTFTTGGSATTVLSQIICRKTAGPKQAEAGATANYIYIFGAQLNTGALGTYAPRTT